MVDGVNTGLRVCQSGESAPGIRVTYQFAAASVLLCGVQLAGSHTGSPPGLPITGGNQHGDPLASEVRPPAGLPPRAEQLPLGLLPGPQPRRLLRQRSAHTSQATPTRPACRRSAGSPGFTTAPHLWHSRRTTARLSPEMLQAWAHRGAQRRPGWGEGSRSEVAGLITLRRLSLGSGYRYLIESIARGGGRTGQSSALTRYYQESGTPPGVFLGGGLAGLGGGEGVGAGSQVSEQHLYRMLGMCVDPLTGAAAGRQPNGLGQSLPERVERRLRRLPAGLSGGERDRARARIETAERAKATASGRPAVAGFDLTFSPSKSVSVAWALADQGTKGVIYECHRRAIDIVLAYAEERVFHSRSGTNGVVQEDIEGVIAAAFTHYDSRSGDPQLHDHVVVWNRARSVSDGQWRTLDSRGLYKETVALSELHQGVLADLLTGALGWGWEPARAARGMIKYEAAGVPEALLAEFSQRVRMIRDRQDVLIEAFRVAHGRAPTKTELLRLGQQANLETRTEKRHDSLAALTSWWQERAARYVGGDVVSWVATLADRNELPLLRADDLAEEMLVEVAEVATMLVAERHATFSRSNVAAEVYRQLQGVRFACPQDRISVAEHTVGLALGGSVRVTAAELFHTPARYRRADGTSRFRPADYHLYTTEALLEAEARLLDAGRRADGPRVGVATVAAISETALAGREYGLSVDQALAVEKIATSGRVLDVLVGPAGTGKSTTMAGLRAVWEAEHGPASVVGLAPSATAAEVLAEELGVAAENTAKWLYEHRQTPTRRLERDRMAGRLGRLRPGAPGAGRLRETVGRLDELIGRWNFRAGQLVIIDEASLAGTFALDEVVTAAITAGAKVVLTGDPFQLSAIDAGGMFRLLVRDRGDVVAELEDIRRFRSSWEAAASLRVRVGDPGVIDTYLAQGRVTGGDREWVVDACYRAWKADMAAGRSSLMIAGDGATVNELNIRAQTDRIAAGLVNPHGLALADGTTAGVGDVVVTRANNRLLVTGRGWVKNGDTWTVTATNPDGSMTLRRAGTGTSEVVLPADYVAAGVELGYACSAHRAQGRTVDTAHAVVSPTTSREVLYVMLTRGRHANHVYVDTTFDPDPATGHGHAIEPRTARQVLAGVLANQAVELSAHETIRASQEAAEALPSLHAEYATIAKAAQQDRWDRVLADSGLLSRDQLAGMADSPAYGPLLAALRDADAQGLDVEAGLPRLVAAHHLHDAADVAAVLHQRVDRWIHATTRNRPSSHSGRGLIAGLIPRAGGVSDPDLAQALAERDQAMERRAQALAELAIQTHAGWVRRLGRPPLDPTGRAEWLWQVRVVAAYRDRWSVTCQSVLGRPDEVGTVEQLGHYKRALAAGRQARAISDRSWQNDKTGIDAPAVGAQTRGVQP